MSDLTLLKDELEAIRSSMAYDAGRLRKLELAFTGLLNAGSERPFLGGESDSPSSSESPESHGASELSAQEAAGSAGPSAEYDSTLAGGKHQSVALPDSRFLSVAEIVQIREDRREGGLS